MILVVADTSPIHYLILINVIDVIARLYDKLIIPAAVYTELSHSHAPIAVQKWIRVLPPWAEIKEPSLAIHVDRLGRGELQAIALAKEVDAASLLLDEWEGRKEALRLGLPVSGTIGVLEKASAQGLLDLRDALSKLLKTNFRISPELLTEILAKESQKRRGDL